MTEYVNKFEKQCLAKLQTTKFDKAGLEKEKIKMHKFLTKSSNDIPCNLLVEAETNLDRKFAVAELNKYLNNEILAMEIERGLFEYVLIHVSTKKLQNHYCYATYYNELYNICNNLDQNNENINNQTLRPALLNGEINPRIVAFLSPQQIHPKRWILFSQKKIREAEVMNHSGTHKDYENKCKNCGGVEFHSYEQQLRSADEPANKFIVCIDCGYTVIQ